MSPGSPRAFPTRTLIVALACLGAVYAFQRSAWPPPVHNLPDGGPALSPAEALKTFYLAPGYKIELVASEPMVVDPIVIDFGPDGRMWVVEMPGFAVDEEGTDSREPIGRIVVLEDVDDDGKMDKRTVFLDELILPRAIKVLDKGVLIGEPPNLWLAQDTDGDGKADKKEKLHDNYGRLQANPEHNANSLLWAIDNWIYTSEHDWYYRFRNGKFEAHRTLNRGQWGISQDDAGRIYRNWNEQPLFVDLISARYFLRNPNQVRTTGLYEELIARNETAPWPIRPTRGVNRGYREGVLRPDGTMTTYLSSATPVIYRGDRLPKELYGDAFITDCSGQFVHRLRIVDDGAGRVRARDAYAKGEFVASTDERFRPVNALAAPDGTLYIVDMYRGIIQDAQYWSEYLRDYIKRNKMAMPVGLGRIYRVVHETTRRDRKPTMHTDSPAKLVAHLSHPNGWWRDMAQQLLVERADRSVVPTLKELALKSPDYRTRLHAMWTLDGLDAIEPAIVTQALDHRHPDVRAAAIRLSERWLAQAGNPLHAAVLRKFDDRNWIVRRQLTASLGELPRDARLAPLARALEQFGGDPVAVDAAISGLSGQETAALDRLLGAKLTAQNGTDALEMLAATITRGRNQAAVQKLVDIAGQDSRVTWQRTAILRGIDTGLPGGGTRGGGRGGFARGAGPSGFSFPQEPVALARLAAGKSGELPELAKRLLARVTWPGKPTPRVEVPALTAAEQKRFADGRELYANVCAGCHQADGQGKEKIAPALVQSQYVIGNPAVTARILLAGKEGPGGMMPPFGATLSDEQLASLITYLRRDWGHTASPVERADVREVRGLTAHRKNPWTEEELSRMAGGFRGARAGQQKQ